MRQRQQPTKKEEGQSSDPHEVYDHPAFGLIGYTVVTGGDQHLFGSDIHHNQRVRLQITRAEHKRSLANDWMHPRKTLIEVEMSHTQFAEMITSPNRGAGTPCTLTRIAGADVPAIEQIETKQEMLRREIQESARGRLDKMMAEVDKLGALIESGKLSKVELRQLHRDLAREVSYLPGSVGFVVEQAEEALEKATTAAKIEIEATIQNHINRIGLNAAQAIGLVTPPKELE